MKLDKINKKILGKTKTRAIIQQHETSASQDQLFKYSDKKSKNTISI